MMPTFAYQPHSCDLHHLRPILHSYSKTSSVEAHSGIFAAMKQLPKYQRRYTLRFHHVLFLMRKQIRLLINSSFSSFVQSRTPSCKYYRRVFTIFSRRYCFIECAAVIFQQNPSQFRQSGIIQCGIQHRLHFAVLKVQPINPLHKRHKDIQRIPICKEPIVIIRSIQHIFSTFSGSKFSNS